MKLTGVERDGINVRNDFYTIICSIEKLLVYWHLNCGNWLKFE